MSDAPLPRPTPSDASCVFCRIVAGEIPCHRLHEDALTLAFLDIGPLSEGHCLIVPRAHHHRLEDVPPETVAACAALVPRLAKAVMKATGATQWNLLQNNGPDAGQVVPHVHFHIIPRREGDGLGYRWPAGKLAPETARRLVGAIASAM